MVFKIGWVSFSDHLCFDGIYYLALVSQSNLFYLLFDSNEKVNYCGSKNKVKIKWLGLEASLFFQTHLMCITLEFFIQLFILWNEQLFFICKKISGFKITSKIYTIVSIVKFKIQQSLKIILMTFLQNYIL